MPATDWGSLETNSKAIVGSWFDAKWKNVVLNAQEMGPGLLRLSWLQKDGSSRVEDVRTIVCDHVVYLDAVDAGTGFDQQANHRLYKVDRSGVWEASVGYSHWPKLKQ
ncbi:MAG TPA: hypothetical protein VFT74_17575, partial [Isosphaeraceae bacterium]|nr:hypothetical protein [Isosphaeraceae bacterium]